MLELNRQTNKQAYQQTLVQSSFVGLSTETKPTTGADGEALTAPCEFYERDTGRRFYWNGTLWIDDGSYDRGDLDTALSLARLERLLAAQNGLLANLARSMRALLLITAEHAGMDVAEVEAAAADGIENTQLQFEEI